MKISRLYFVALGALILFAAGCGGNGSVVPAGAGNLTGYIYTRSYNSGSAARQTMRAASATVPDGYIPVSGAKVELLNNNIDPVTTGSDGMFLFTNLTAGRYTVRVTKKDPVTNADILTPLEFQVTVSQNVTNVVNDSFAATDISMDPIATGTLTVTASVDCAVAVPVNGEVYINDVNTFATTPIALFNDIGVGTYRVHVNAAGYQVPPDKDAIITQGGSINLAFILAPQGNATPFATIATPADNATVVAGNAVALTGGAVDCEDGNLTGAALAWTSSIDGALGTGAALSLTTLSIGTHTITLKATDSDGAFTTASITLNVNAAGSNTAPTASLIAPANGAVFAPGAVVNFLGAGTDTQDGVLASTALRWTSSRDGVIGTGLAFTKTTLSTGTHVITLTATDSGGLTGSSAVTITIGGAPAANASPVAVIATPLSGSSFLSGSSILFTGAAVDAEDGTITGASLIWTSSLSGAVGTGSNFIKNNLPVGSHLITLTATDLQGATGIATASVTITAAP